MDKEERAMRFSRAGKGWSSRWNRWRKCNSLQWNNSAASSASYYNLSRLYLTMIQGRLPIHHHRPASADATTTPSDMFHRTLHERTTRLWHARAVRQHYIPHFIFSTLVRTRWYDFTLGHNCKSWQSHSLHSQWCIIKTNWVMRYVKDYISSSILCCYWTMLPCPNKCHSQWRIYRTHSWNVNYIVRVKRLKHHHSMYYHPVYKWHSRHPIDFGKQQQLHTWWICLH